MRELTVSEISGIGGGVKLGRFLLDAALGAITGAISGAMAGPGGMLAGALTGVVVSMASNAAHTQYDAMETNAADRQRQLEQHEREINMLYHV